MKKIVILIAAAVLFVGANSFADTIVLKSGKQIDATVLGRSSDSIEIDSNGVKLSYPIEEVDTINGEQIFVVTPRVNPVIAEAAPAEAPQVEAKPKEPPASAVEPAKAEVNSLKPKVDEKVVAIVLLVIVFILLLVYIYSAICLQFIAKNTNTSPAWLAWVPAGNIFLMCKIGGVNYWWMLALLLLFVPWYIISTAVSLGFFGFVWYKIALARNKPGWVGILTVIPLVNLFIYGYLAFSNHKKAPMPQPVSPPPQPTPPAQGTPTSKQ